MPLTLDDFNTIPASQIPKIEDFNNPQPQAIGLNDDTISNLAAHVAALGDSSSLLKTYSAVTNELKSGTSSSTLDDMLKQQHSLDYAATFSELKKVLADPNISVEDKTKYTTGFANLTAEPLGSKSINTTVSAQAAIADSNPSEDNDETNITRLNPAASFDDVDAYNGWVQKQVNTIRNTADPQLGDQLRSIVEGIIPFMSGAAQANVKASLDSNPQNQALSVAQSLTLLGESKQAVRDAIFAMPPDKRYEIANQVLGYIQQSQGSVLNSPNTLNMISQIQQELTSGGYTNYDRTVDNITSLMDASIFLGPIASFVRGAAKGGAEVAATARRAELAAKNIQAATPEVNEVVTNLKQIEYKPTVYVNKAGEASTDLESVGSPPHEVVNTAADMITDKIMSKFNTPATKTPSGEMAQVVDDLGGSNIDFGSVRQDVRNKVGEILTPHTYNDSDITKKITDGVGDVLKQRYVQTPKTYKATASQLIRQSIEESNAQRRAVRTNVSPTSLSQTYKDVNPGKARAAFNVVDQDTSGQAAKILYGTTRSDALANDLLPEVKAADDSVRNKVQMINDKDVAPDQSVIDKIGQARGDIHFYPAEKEQMRNTAIADFRDVVGLVPRNAMATVGDGIVPHDTGVSFDMVYGPKDGSFRSPKQAISQVVRGLAKYGVTRDEVQILARNADGNWEPMKVGKDATINDGNYLVRVKHNYQFSPADTTSWTLTSTSGWRMFDSRVPWTSGKQGGLAQHFIPSTAIVDKRLLDAFSSAADKNAWISKTFDNMRRDYAKLYNGLDKRQKGLVDDYITEANYKSLKFDALNLKARGLNDNAVETLRKWKSIWDTMYHFENVDLNKTLRARGFQQYIDQKNNTSLLVKPVGRALIDPDEPTLNRMVNSVIRYTGQHTFEAYDSTIDKMVTLSKDDLTKLYKDGGQIAKTRSPIQVVDKSFEYVIVHGNEENSWLRRIRDTDTNLNYRDGYYTIRYDQPYFITKAITLNGKVYHKAIATTDNLKDGVALRDRLRATDEQGLYNIRGDLKKGSAIYDDHEWSTMVSGGRTSQRIRGQRLADASGIQTDLDHAFVEAPEDSLIRSIRSLSQRTAFRDAMDTAKTRWLHQFGDLVENRGLNQWPEDARVIGKGNIDAPSSRIKDAITTWRYIDAVDSGYVNLIDDASKWMFKQMSEEAGRKGWGWLETGARAASTKGPVRFIRNKAFRLFLAFNPLRQLPVQALQAMPVILATNPKFAVTGKLASQMMLLSYLNRGGDIPSFMKAFVKNGTGLTVDQMKELVMHYEHSGFESAVNAHSLIRDDLSRLTDASIGGRINAAAKIPGDVMQNLGFNAGENLLMRSVWLSEYDNLLKTGVKITPEKEEALIARVRHLTGNMNRAGEMPYNENSLSGMLQFFQTSHKLFAQVMMGHNGLTTADRIKLGTAYLLTYGVGGTALTNWIMSKVNAPSDVKDSIEGGLFNVLLNKSLSYLYHQDVKTDFSDSLRIIRVPDMFNFWQSLWGQHDLAQALAVSPSLSLVLGQNPRFTNFVRQLVRPFMVPNDQKPEEINLAVKSFFSMFSGFSNAFKAQYILANHKAISSTGITADFHVNDVEGWLHAAGFNTIDEVHKYAFDTETYKASEQYKNDIDYQLTEISRRLAAQGISNDDANYIVDAMQEAQKVWNNDPFYMREFASQLLSRAGRGEFTLYKTILKLAGFTDEDQLKQIINDAPIDDGQKQMLYSTIGHIKEAQ